MLGIFVVSKPGDRLSFKRFYFVDIDECTESVDLCDKTTTTCRNLAGGYYCDCKPGYEKGGDRYKCNSNSLTFLICIIKLILTWTRDNFGQYAFYAQDCLTTMLTYIKLKEGFSVVSPSCCTAARLNWFQMSCYCRTGLLIRRL